MKNFETVATYTYPHEYTVLKLILEREHISYFFQNETMVGVLPFYSNALGGIHLKVHKKDVQRTLEIINDLDKKKHLRIV